MSTDRRPDWIALCAALAGLWSAPALAQPSGPGASAAPNDLAETSEDAFRRNLDHLAPPSPDPRNIEGVYYIERSFAAPKTPPKYRPGKAPVPPPPGVSLPSPMVECRPAAHYTGGGGGMAEEFVQSPGEIVLINEEDHSSREIFMDRKAPPHGPPQPSGYSTGRWEGPVLVVETSGFSRQANGLSPAARVVERIEKIEGGKLLKHTVTVVDPTRFTEPYVTTFAERYRPDSHINEAVCEEGFKRYRIIDGEVVNPNTPDEAGR